MMIGEGKGLNEGGLVGQAKKEDLERSKLGGREKVCKERKGGWR